MWTQPCPNPACDEHFSLAATRCPKCGTVTRAQPEGLFSRVDAFLDKHLWLKVLVLASVVVAGLTLLSQSNLFGGSEESDDYPDRACLHYVNSVQDFNDGILTESEMRARMQEVLTEARGTTAEAPARGIVAALTQGDTAALGTELANMNRVCADEG